MISCTSTIITDKMQVCIILLNDIFKYEYDHNIIQYIYMCLISDDYVVYE